jgi:hypothetical protein
MLQHEVEFGCGFSVRIFDNAAQLASAAGYYQSAFVVGDLSHGMHASLIINASSVTTNVLWYGATALKM